MMLQINTVMLGELASPGVRHSRVQQNTSGLPNFEYNDRRNKIIPKEASRTELNMSVLLFPFFLRVCTYDNE